MLAGRSFQTLTIRQEKKCLRTLVLAIGTTNLNESYFIEEGRLTLIVYI